MAIVFISTCILMVLLMIRGDNGPTDYKELDPARNILTPLIPSVSGSEVIALQNALAGATFPIQPNGTPPSGIYDNATLTALLLFQSYAKVPANESGFVSVATMAMFDSFLGIQSCPSVGLARLTDSQVTTAISNGAVAVLNQYWNFPVGTEIPFIADNQTFVGRIELHFHPYGGSMKPWGYITEFRKNMSVSQREDYILLQLASRNIPKYILSQFVPAVATLPSSKRNVTFYAARDYLAIGTDLDFVRMPCMAFTAQKLADLLNASLPTTRMVDLIWQQSSVKLDPQPIPPSDEMCENPVIAKENDLIESQLSALGNPEAPFIGGDKKDTVLTNQYTSHPNSVAEYGWHQSNGVPIQPLYMGHSCDWADYSMGIRLISHIVHVDGDYSSPVLLSDALSDPELAPLLSDEGAITSPRVPINHRPAAECWTQSN